MIVSSFSRKWQEVEVVHASLQIWQVEHTLPAASQIQAQDRISHLINKTAIKSSPNPFRKLMLLTPSLKLRIG